MNTQSSLPKNWKCWRRNQQINTTIIRRRRSQSVHLPCQKWVWATILSGKMMLLMQFLPLEVVVLSRLILQREEWLQLHSSFPAHNVSSYLAIGSEEGRNRRRRCTVRTPPITWVSRRQEFRTFGPLKQWDGSHLPTVLQVQSSNFYRTLGDLVDGSVS